MKRPEILTACLILLILPTSAVSQDTVNITGLDVALKTLPFLESMPQKDNILVYSKECQNDACTPNNNAYKQTRAWLVLAYTELYKSTGESKYLDKAKENMRLLTRDCDPQEDPDCKYIGVQAEAAYQTIKDDQYLDYLRPIDPSIVSVGAAQQGEAMLKAIAARELFLAYKDGIYTNFIGILGTVKAVDMGIQDRNTLITHNGAKMRETECWAQLAYLEFYKSIAARHKDGDILPLGANASAVKKSVLVRPRQLFDTMDFSTLADDPNAYPLTMTELEPCAEALITMSDVTGDQKYRKKAQGLMTGLLNTRWDSEYDRKFEGDNSFLSQGCRQDSSQICYHNAKITTDNAYAVYLFARLGNETFQIDKQKQTQYYFDLKDDPKMAKQVTETTLQKQQEQPATTSSGYSSTLIIAVTLIFVIVIVLAVRRTKR